MMPIERVLDVGEAYLKEMHSCWSVTAIATSFLDFEEPYNHWQTVWHLANNSLVEVIVRDTTMDVQSYRHVGSDKELPHFFRLEDGAEPWKCKISLSQAVRIAHEKRRQATLLANPTCVSFSQGPLSLLRGPNRLLFRQWVVGMTVLRDGDPGSQFLFVDSDTSETHWWDHP